MRAPRTARSRLAILLTASLATTATIAVAAAGSACSGDAETANAPPPLSTGAPVVRDAAPPEAAPKADASPVDAGVEARHFTGTLAATASSDFGGSPYCKYKITLKQIEVDVTLDSASHPVGATVTDLAVEETVPPCTFPPAPASIHEFALASSVPLPSGGLHLELAPDPANQPVAALILEGNFASDSVEASLEWHRTDQKEPLDWRVTATLPLVRR